MASHFAEMRLLFHINRFLKTTGHIREIHAEASCQVDETPLP